MDDAFDSNKSVTLEDPEAQHSATTPPRVEIAAWKHDATFCPADTYINPDQPQEILSPEHARTLLGGQTIGIDISDKVSTHTQNDRGYVAALEAFGSSTIRSRHSPKNAETDLAEIGSVFKPPPVATRMNGSITTSMDRDVCESLTRYAGHDDGPDWLPVPELLRIFTRLSVYRALKEDLSDTNITDDALREYARKICPKPGVDSSVGSRSVFAILTHLDRVGEILEFIDCGLTDENLSFVGLPGERGSNGRLFPRNLPVGELECWKFGSRWPHKDWTAFGTYQKKMRSPFFKLKSGQSMIPHFDLEPGTVLPFIKDHGPKEVTRYSQVRCVQIHLGHHTMHKGHNEGNPYFAVKQLLPEHDETKETPEINFREEVRALTKTVGHSSHDHVIKLLATWRQGNKWNMLFPWAKSSLKDYWMSRNPERTRESVQWVAKQCRGLAEGLQKIHRSPSDHATDFGIHGDIKPENILLFEDERHPEGILVISDFGFTRFHGRETRSNRPAVGYSPTHRAPELDLDHKIARSYDIWALGCVFLELITWYLAGTYGVGTEFVQRRVDDDRVGRLGFRYDKFFNIRLTKEGREEPEVKGSVREWIEELRTKPHCSEYFQEFLTFILNELLCVNPKDRAKCDKVAIALRELETACQKNDTNYSLGQDPRVVNPGSATETSSAERQAVPPCIPLQDEIKTWCSWSDRGSKPSLEKDRQYRLIMDIDTMLPTGNGEPSNRVADNCNGTGSTIMSEASTSTVEDNERTPLIPPSTARHNLSQGQPIVRRSQSLPLHNDRVVVPTLHNMQYSLPKTTVNSHARDTGISGVVMNARKGQGEKRSSRIETDFPQRATPNGDSFGLKAILRYCLLCSKSEED